jgi:hypothetical protein
MTTTHSESGSSKEQGQPHEDVQNVYNFVKTETQETEIPRRWMKVYRLCDKNAMAISGWIIFM